ncbi:MAG: PIN domain-containing protein [Thermaerobacter sp.]|nr:PIN domain-containing protein [Thermaerobacter sp.]
MAFVAFLDACVLYQATLRDVLLSLAEEDVYQVRWSPHVLDEMVKNVGARLGLDPKQALAGAEYARSMMEQAFPDAAVEPDAYVPLVPVMANHPKDRHVLAAAIVARADVLVTSNIKDFPTAACQPYNLEVQHPDIFLQHQFGLNPELITMVLVRLASERKQPPMTDVEDILTALQVEHPRFVAMARTHIRKSKDA